MSKLDYPKDGLRPRCRASIENTIRDLSDALGSCNLDVPASFRYKTYLDNLGAKISGYRQETKSISAKIDQTDRNFTTLSDLLTASANKLTTPIFPRRDRLA